MILQGESRDVDNTESPPNQSCSESLKKTCRDICSVNTAKKRLPILQWLPKYNAVLLIQDIVAGIAVGLTAIPQSIAYAVVAGLQPQYGLYSAFIGGFVYVFFGSTKDVTIGPTAILAVMLAKFVTYGSDFAILAAFLSGCICLLLGIFNLGFLVNFISNPVVSGFTTAAAMQIASTQIKSLFGLSGTSGTTFVQTVEHFIKNIKTIKLWDSVMGVCTIIMLVLLKEFGRFSSRTDVPGFSRTKNIIWKVNWFVCLARNAVVVIVGIVLAYCIKVYMDLEPFALTGEINGGLPHFKLPPFSTVVGNETYTFTDMLNTYGPQSIVIPLISILETVAVAKAFAKGKMLDATQEMIALGLCNIAGSFLQSMPITGSFTRTAINNASGVQTQAGGVIKGLMVILALSAMTSVFYYIPRATLAGLIIIAMYGLTDFVIIIQLWRNKKSEWCIFMVTALSCLFVGLEYGIIFGILADAFLLLFSASRPSLRADNTKIGGRSGIIITLPSHLSYCAADHLSKCIQGAINKYSRHIIAPQALLIVLDGRRLQTLDTTVARNLVTVIRDLEKNSHSILFWNFPHASRTLCEAMAPNTSGKFIVADSLQDYLSDPLHSVEDVRTD